MTDLHGEFAASRFFHEARMDRRSADALVGLSAGLIADGAINQQEAEFLHSWIKSNLAHLDDPVINILYRRLADMLQDGVLDEEESAELLSMLNSFAGLNLSQPKPVLKEFATPNDLPLCNPAPELTWQDKTFVFTGVMAYGPRKVCQDLIVERGGIIGGAVSKKVHYLVIGSVGNEQWRHSSYGTKIIKALELRDCGSPIAIISEEYWQSKLFQ